MPELNPGTAIRAVVDTNVWLDWLVFEDPHAAIISVRTADTILCVVSSDAARDELVDVLGRDIFGLTESRRTELLARHDQRIDCQFGPGTVSMTRLRCSDRDDQKFIELAVISGARILLTRDKALLKLRKRALREHSLTICTPQIAQTTPTPAPAPTP